MARSALFEQDLARLILESRGQRVMLDADLATLYGVSTKALVQAVKRNLDRFPRDFMFQVTEQEVAILRSQIVTSSSADSVRWGGRRWLPYAFSEQGVAMLSSVLRSRVSGHDKDIATIVRAIRELAAPPAPGKKRSIGFISSS
jgi:hypothetical protein